MEVSSWENHLFLWAMASMAMLNNQRLYEYCIILRYLSSAKCMFIQCKRSMSRHSDWKGNSFWKLIDPLQLAMTWHTGTWNSPWCLTQKFSTHPDCQWLGFAKIRWSSLSLLSNTQTTIRVNAPFFRQIQIYPNISKYHIKLVICISIITSLMIWSGIFHDIPCIS